MGIQQTKSLLKVYYSSNGLSKDPNDFLQKGFNPECLQLIEFIDKFWNEKCVEHLDKMNVLDPKKSGINQREKDKFNIKEKIIYNEIPIEKQNMNDAFNINSLSEFREPFIPEDTLSFSQSQMKKMNILLIAYVRKILLTCNENSTIECITKYFNSAIQDKTKINLNSIGINLFIKLFSDISKGDVKIKEKNLDFLLENSKFIRPLAFWGESKEHFMLDKSLDSIIEYLKEIIEDENETELNKMKSLKIIFNLALAKGSLKNLLDVIESYNKLPNPKIDFNYEINLFKNEFIKFSLSSPDKSNQKLISEVWNYTIYTEKEKKPNPNLKEQNQTFYSSTCDGSYLYLFISKGYLLKIGTGYNNTMMGKVYLSKEDYRSGEKGTIAIVDNILYYRSNQLDPNPVISINPDNLEEIENKFDVDYREINHIFIEEKKSEFEFPHSSYEEMMDIIERKKNMGLDDRSNVRPSAASPMLTDGRYIYIISKWFDNINNEEDRKEDDEENENEIDNNKKEKENKAIFGVNIYDPLNNMCHVRSVQLNMIKADNFDENEEKKIENLKGLFNNNNNNNDNNGSLFGNSGIINPFYSRRNNNNNHNQRNRNLNNINNNNSGNESKKELNGEFLQGQNEFYTNGNILMINKFKFSLITGQLLGEFEVSGNVINRTFCYDFKNNLIWCIKNESENKPLQIESYFNQSAKPIVEYPKNHPKYASCSVEKIIESCENNIKMLNLTEEVNVKKYDKQLTLSILGLEDENSAKYKEINIINNNENINDNDKYKMNIQCLILNTIAKLSEFYGQVPDLRIATNDIERGKILSEVMRRPFCVKLEPIVFEKIIKFLNLYSVDFLKGKFTDTEAYCLLAIVKIIRTNLKCLSISNLGVDYFIHRDNKNKSNPFLEMKAFIFKILEMYHNIKNSADNKDKELIKALYEECKIILMVSVNTLYQNYDEIIQVLKENIYNYENNPYSKDIAKCILIWLSNEDNIHNVFLKTDKNCIDTIFEILRITSNWEVVSVKKFLQSNLRKIDIKDLIFHNSDDELVSFSFISSLQMELFKNLSQKLLNDQYDDIKNELLVTDFTNIIFNGVLEIFKQIQSFIEKYISFIKKDYDNKYYEDEEDDFIDTSDMISTSKKEKEEPKKKKKIPKFEDYKKQHMNNLYTIFLDQLININLLSIKTFQFHINVLSILGSDYLLSACLLESFTDLIKQMNLIYITITKNMKIKKESKIEKNSEYKEIIFETNHPYNETNPVNFILDIPEEEGPLYLEFDPQCAFSEQYINSVGLYFYSDSKMTKYYSPKLRYFNKEFPKETIELKTHPVYASFKNHYVNNSEAYGVKLKLHNGKEPNKKKKKNDEYFNLIRGLCWVGCKCASIVIKGNFMKVVVGSEDQDKKYKNVLNSKLFSGGIEYEEIKKDNDNLVNNIITIFDKFIKSEKKNQNIRYKEEMQLFKDENCKKVLKYFQKKLAEKNPAANVGGEDAFNVVSAAFLCLIHHSCEIESFIEICKKKFENENEIQNLPIYNSLYKKYMIAGQMRSWLIEKRKNVAEAIEKQKPNQENNLSNNQENDNEQNALNIMKKIVNQTINKAKFLMKINPTPALKGDNNLKSLQNSIIPLLQENLSNKKLYKNIKLSTIRAIGRYIGLNTIKNIFLNIHNGDLLQDLLSWFCSSLRNYNEYDFNNFSHYLDNVPGCGQLYENKIQESFQNFMSILISKNIQNKNEKELESFLDSLIWRYGANDHEFLVDKGLFNIIWGLENETIKSAWGKSVKMITKSEVNDKNSNNRKNEKIQSKRELPSDILEIFEILSSICFNRVINDNENNSELNQSLSLERKTSTINNNSTISLIQNILNIIFGEITKATDNYYNYRGISYSLFNQYMNLLEEGENKKSKEKKKKELEQQELDQAARQRRTRRYSGSITSSEFDDNSIMDDDFIPVENDYDINISNNNYGLNLNKKKEKKEKEKPINEDKPYFFYENDLINVYDDFYKQNPSFGLLNVFGKKNGISGEELKNMVNSQWEVIYNPEFLNRLLRILYKASIQKCEIIAQSITSSESIYTLIKLMKYCSTENQFLCAKTLMSLSLNSDEIIFNEVLEIYKGEYVCKYKNYIELLIGLAINIRKKSWMYNNYNSTGNYIISNILIDIIRQLAYANKCKKEINEIINSKLYDEKTKEIDYLKEEIILGIIGGDYYGQANGSKVRVPNEIHSSNINFNFIKKDYKEQKLTGTIIGFSSSFHDYFGITQSKPLSVPPNGRNRNNPHNNINEKKKELKFETISITPNNSIENQVGVLMDGSLLNTKESFNINELTPKIYEQYAVMPFQQIIDYEKFEISDEKLNDLILFLIENNDMNSKIINLKTNILRFLSNYINSKKAIESLYKNEKLKDIINYIVNLGEETISNKNCYLNLEFNEEKRYRIQNFCNENKESLNEIPKLNISFRNSNNYLIRIYKNGEQILNLCNTILNCINKQILLLNSNYYPFSIYNDEKSDIYKMLENSIIFVNNKDLLNNLLEIIKTNYSKQVFIILTDLKIKDFVQNDFICYIQIPTEDLEEIIEISFELENVKDQNFKNPTLKSMDMIKRTYENDSTEIINELVNDFGFEREIVIKELKKCKDKTDINDIIGNLLEASKINLQNENEDKKKEEDNKNEELNNDDIENNDEIKKDEYTYEKEEKNQCFGTDNSNEKPVVPDYFDELFININENKNLLFQYFKNISSKITIFYSRRIIISIIEQCLEYPETFLPEKIFENIENEKIFNIIKLLVHEGLFVVSNGLGVEILLRIKALLLNLRKSKNKKFEDIIKTFNEKSLQEIEFVLNEQSEVYNYILKDEKLIVNKPFIFFDIWNLLINSEFDDEKNHLNYYQLFNNLSGLIPKILENKQIRWFILELLIQNSYKILNVLQTNPKIVIEELENEKLTKFHYIPNIKNLSNFLKKSMLVEGQKNYSKRTQLITELLLLICEIDKKIGEKSLENISSNEENEKIGKFQKIPENSVKYNELYSPNAMSKLENFLYELLSTSSIMRHFFDMNFIKYLGWIEMNPDVISFAKLSYESSHLYSKAPHTYLIHYPNTSALEINMKVDTYLDQGDSITFSTDKNCKNPLKCFVNDDEANFTVNSSHIYVNFPSNYLTSLYAFGANAYGRFGKTSSSDIITPKSISQLSNVLIKDIAIGDTYTLILTEDGEILSAGNGVAAGLKQTSDKFTNENKYNKSDKLLGEKFSKLCVYNGSSIVITKDNSFFSVGINNNGQLGQAYTSPVNDITSMNFTKQISQISMSETHTLLVTSEGKLWHIGNNDYNQNGEPASGRNNSPKPIQLNKNDFVEMVAPGEFFSVFIIRDLSTGKKNLYTAGWSKNGRTGCKEQDIQQLKKLTNPQIENKEFKFITATKMSAAAITNEGELFTWGSNTKGQLGHGHFNDVNEPTLVKFFEEEWEVIEISMQVEFSIVLARNKKTGKNEVFVMGDNVGGKLGVSLSGVKTEKKDTFSKPIMNTFFNDKEPIKIFSGPRGTIIMCKVKPFELIRDFHNEKCHKCNLNIIGNLIYNLENNFMFCQKCSDQDNLDNNVLVVKAPMNDYNLIKSIFEKNGKIEFENNESGKIICNSCGEEINPILENSNNKKNHYYLYQENNKERKYLCEYCISHYTPVLTNAKVFYKSNDFNKVLSIKSISNLNETNYYGTSIGYGYKFSITPIFNDVGCEKVINKFSKSFKAFSDELKSVNKFEIYEQFVDYLNEMSQKADKSIFNYSLKDLVFKKESLSIRSELSSLPNEVLRKMFLLLKVLNEKVKNLLPYIDFSKSLQSSQRLSTLFSRITPLIFWDTKNESIQYYLENTSYTSSPGELKINRMKVRKFIDKGKPDLLGENTIFGAMFQHLRNYNFKIFRKKKESGNNNSSKLFTVNFVGEASIDAGGPYRECLSQAFSELQSSALSLFIPSPNQKNESGSFREKWVVNPGANSIIELEMYKVFGGLIGYAIRTGEFINMDLPSIFWKSLLEVPKDRKDLEMIDKYAIQFLDDINRISDKDQFTLYSDYKFTTILSNGSEVPIIENGRNIDLTLENKKNYIELVEQTRLNEGQIQIDSIRNGLEQVIPVGILKLISWNELEMLVCGKPILDIELLKENTLYRGCNESDEIVQYFWKCLEEFTAEERAMYLRFVWGRSRLPLTSKDFPMKHRVEMLHHSNPDVALPQSHTCFFSLEIPKYSSYEILHDKLKYAITHCQAIDTDGNAREIWDDED